MAKQKTAPSAKRRSRNVFPADEGEEERGPPVKFFSVRCRFRCPINEGFSFFVQVRKKRSHLQSLQLHDGLSGAREKPFPRKTYGAIPLPGRLLYAIPPSHAMVSPQI
jgi:hypothetical protein